MAPVWNIVCSNGMTSFIYAHLLCIIYVNMKQYDVLRYYETSLVLFIVKVKKYDIR